MAVVRSSSLSVVDGPVQGPLTFKVPQERYLGSLILYFFRFHRRMIVRARLIIAAVTSLALAGSTQAAEIKLLASSAIKDAYLELLPLFEKATGHKVTAAWSSIS